MLKLILGAALALIGVYFVIRLLELDHINRKTPNQEDPLFDDDREMDG